jgi:hypothetical protein
MIFARSLFTPSALLPALLLSGVSFAAPTTTPAQSAYSPDDPCAKVAGQIFVDTADAIACQKSFPFNETLRQNVLSVVSRVFDFYTFEDYYLKSPAPFQDSTTDIRAEIRRINSTRYAVSVFRTPSNAFEPLLINFSSPFRLIMSSIWPSGTSRCI